jgi:shikimate kinase
MGSNEPPARSSCRGGSGDKGLTSDSDIHGATRRGASGEGANAAAADGALLGTAVGRRVIALVGMMGSGKTSIGKRLATRLGLPFVDSDSEIETAAGMTITEIFDRHGEAYFREGERRVIARLLGEGPCVLATGGGAFMDARTREAIAEAGISVWLRADTATLMQRIARRNNRPLLRTADPAAQVARLLALREPIYARADLIVDSSERPHDEVVGALIASLVAHLRLHPRAGASS